MKKVILLLLILFFPLACLADVVTVEDILGRKVEIEQPVSTLFLADSRDILALDIVTGDKFFSHIVGWSDSLPQFAPDMQASYVSKYPSMKNIPVIGKSGIDIGEEVIIKLKPDVVIANAKSYQVFTETKALDKLEDAGIKVVFIDFMNNVDTNTPASVTLLGKVLQSEERANKFNDIYHRKMATIRQLMNTVTVKPSVLIEKHGGLTGLDYCCGMSGKSGFGDFVAKAGGNNLLAEKTPGKNSEVNIESLITMDPQYYIVTGADWTAYSKKSVAVALGYQAKHDNISTQLTGLINRKGFAHLRAVKNHQVMAIYHHFYDNPLNFIAIEAIANFIHPGKFADLDAKSDLHDIHQQFMSIADDGIFWITPDNL